MNKPNAVSSLQDCPPDEKYMFLQHLDPISNPLESWTLMAAFGALLRLLLSL